MAILSMRKTETIKFGDFLSGEYKDTKKKIKRTTAKIERLVNKIPKEVVAIPLIGPFVIASTTVLASAPGPLVASTEAVPVGAITDEIKSQIIHAFDPLFELMVEISLPIAGIMITGGALMIMIGQKDAGMKLIMNSSLGYVLVQMTPLLISLLAGVGSAI